MDLGQAPKISICCITYNHKDYISDCIDGFIMQKTNFPVEILIFDDASTDGTQKIIREYAAKHSNIRTFLQTENQWIKQKYGLLDWLFPNAKGKYIALCEGDDYWTDPLKLQKQVDFLEGHNDYSICYHRVHEQNESDGKITLEKLNTSEHEETYTILDLAKQNIIHTPSVVFRNHINSLPDWLVNSPAGDYPLHLLNARYGKIKFFPQPMAVYRLHSQSTWSSNNQVFRVRKWMKVMAFLIPEFKKEKQVHDTLLLQLLANYRILFNYYINNHDIITLKKVTKDVLKDIPCFMDLWFDNFYGNQIYLASMYPTGVRKSAKHFMGELINRFK